MDSPQKSLLQATPNAKDLVTFPHVLHAMLLDLDQAEDNGVVSWAPHGRCFVVNPFERNVFCSTYLPLWFNMTSFPSFQRQLNLVSEGSVTCEYVTGSRLTMPVSQSFHPQYGFKRIGKGPDKGGYFHKLFLRGKPELVDDIKRIKLKGT